MLRYVFIRGVAQQFPFLVLWLYVGAMMITMTLVFIHPPVGLLLFWMGLVGLVPAILTSKVLLWLEHVIARSFIGAEICPKCGQRGPTPSATPCPRCGWAFGEDGAALVKDPAPR